MTRINHRWTLARFLVLTVALLAAMPASAAQQYLDYLFRSPALAGSGLDDAFSVVLDNVDNHRYLKADALMDTILAKPATAKLGPATQAKLLTDAGILKAVNDQDSKSIALLQHAVETVVASIHRYSPLQFNALMVEGMINANARHFPAAIQYFRRAQHVLHLQDGVYTRKQIPVLEQLTRVDQARGTLLAADVQQRFDLRIVERAYGANSEQLIPTLEQVGSYFANRGSSLPRFIMNPDAAARWLQNKVPSQYLSTDDAAFSDTSWSDYTDNGGLGSQIRYFRASLFDQAVNMYNRAINILDNKYGPDDLRLVPPLKGLSRIRLQQGGHDRQSKKAMARATDIVMNSPSTNIEDHVNALVELGDLYTVTGDSRASKRYLDAWRLLNGHPEMKRLQGRLFARPHRLYPPPASFGVQQRPIEAKDGDRLYAKLRFTVDPRGIPRSVRIIDANIPATNRNGLARYFELNVRYRPRIVNGQVVSTDGVTYLQSFVAVTPTEKALPKSKPGSSASSEVARNDAGKK